MRSLFKNWLEKIYQLLVYKDLSFKLSQKLAAHINLTALLSILFSFITKSYQFFKIRREGRSPDNKAA